VCINLNHVFVWRNLGFIGYGLIKEAYSYIGPSPRADQLKIGLGMKFNSLNYNRRGWPYNHPSPPMRVTTFNIFSFSLHLFFGFLKISKANILLSSIWVFSNVNPFKIRLTFMLHQNTFANQK
jgi:hypothetical protein